jgi:hypothetical protein
MQCAGYNSSMQSSYLTVCIFIHHFVCNHKSSKCPCSIFQVAIGHENCSAYKTVPNPKVVLMLRT